jgi:hypothetical protein
LLAHSSASQSSQALRPSPTHHDGVGPPSCRVVEDHGCNPIDAPVVDGSARTDARHSQHERRFLYQVLGLTDCLDRKATRECVLDDVHDARGRPALCSDGSDVGDEIGNRRLLVHSDEEAQREAIASSDSDDVVGVAVP